MTDIYRLTLPNGEFEYAQMHSIGNNTVAYHLAIDQGSGGKGSIIVNESQIFNDKIVLENGDVIKIKLVTNITGLTFD